MVHIKMNKIGLVAGSSGDSLTDKLKERGFKVYLVAGKEEEPGVSTADKVLIENLENKHKISTFFIKNEVKDIIIATGHNLAIELAEFLENQNINISVDYKKSKLCKDKINFKDKIKSLGYKTPKYWTISNIKKIKETLEKIEFPVVIKSATDKTQPEKIWNIEDAIILSKKILELGSRILIEEYIEGNDCTMAVVNDTLNIEALEITYYSKAKEYKLKGFDNSKSNKMTGEIEGKIKGISEKIIKDLKIEGVPRVDYIVKDKEIYILEINSIIITGYNGSAYPFFDKQGVDIADIAVKTALKILELKRSNK